MSAPRMPRALAFLTLVTAMCFTGANVPFGKAIAAEVPVPLFLLFRFAVATAVLALLARTEPGPRLAGMTRADMRDLLLLAALGSVAFNVFTLEGVKRTSGMDAGIILATLPAVAAAMGLLVRGETPGKAQWAAIGLAVAGLVVVNAFGVPPAAVAGAPASSHLGNALVGAAVLCEATFVLVSGRMSARYRPIRLSLGVSAAGLLMSVPIAAPYLAAAELGRIDAQTWLLGLWYALAASVFCTILWYKGAAHVETWMAGLATAAVPVSALAVSALFLGERLSWDQAVGALLVIAAIVLGALLPRRRAGPPGSPPAGGPV